MRLLAGLGVVAIAASSLAVGGTGTAYASGSSAVNVDFADFSSVAGLAMVGTTSVAAGSALQLTNSTDGNQAGGFWLTTPIDTARDFSSHFRYLTVAGTGTVGDGFTFTIQNAGTSALGSCGAGLGYTASACDGSAAISPSEAYAFDAAAGNEVFDGSDGTLTDAGTSYVDPHNGTIEQGWVDYAAATHTLTLYTAAANVAKPATPTAQRTIADLSAWTGSTYLGFTGGTGTDLLEQDVKSWSVHQPLDAPGSVSALAGPAGAAAGHATVAVSWDPPADDPNSAQVASYTVYRSTSASIRGSAIGTVNASPFTDTSATGGATYYYTVTDTANGVESPGTTSSQVTAAKTLPSAPLGLNVDSTVSGQAVPTGGGSVSLGWNAPTDFGGDADVDFDIFRSVNGAAFVKIANGIQPGNQVGETYHYTDSNLNAAHYAYKVEAFNSQGDGPDSNTVTADIATVITAPGGPAADAPLDPTLAVDGQGRTVLSWTAPTDTSGSTVAHYTVYRAIGTEAAPSTSFSVYQDNVTATSLPTQTLAAGTGFVSYYVVAVLANSAVSPHSATATVFVPEAPVVQSVTSPANGRAVVTGSIANVPNTVSVSYAALAFGAHGVCTTCVSTPDGNGADIAGLGSGDWRFRLVPTTTYGDGTALGPASSLSATTLTLHTIRYVSAAVGVDTGDCTVAATPCLTITRGLAQATAGDEVLVSPGTYAEGADISTSSGPIGGSLGFHYTGAAITKPLQLIANSSSGNPVVVDATGHNNGLVIDLGDNFDNATGTSSSGPAVNADVRVSGFTFENADAEGLFAFNSDALRIDNNVIQNNDKGSFTSSITDDLGECTSDCGDGLHLDGVTRSVVIDNIVQDNSGGILLDDSLANFPQVSVPSEGNTIIHNTVVENSLGSGITLDGRDRSTLLGGFSLGVFDNAITNNKSTGNGAGGHGAGILLTVDAPGDGVYQNTVRGNILANDSLPGIAIHAHDALAYMDDNVVEANQISSTGLGGIDGLAGDRAAGATATTGIVVLGVAANPVGGTIIQDNVISAVHFGVFLNEASSNFSGNGYTGVSVPVTTIPGPLNVYVGRGTNGHLYVNRGSIGRATDLGGSLAGPPAVGAIPTWNANAFGAGHGYWTNQMAPLYVIRTTAGRIAVRSDSVSWTNLPVPTSGGRAVALSGTPAVAGSAALDNGLDGGQVVVGVAALSTTGDLWLTSLVIGPNRNVVGIRRSWHNYGHPSGSALTGTPALTGLFFTDTAWAAAKNGYLYSMSFDPQTADWHGIGKPWVRHGYHAITVAGSTSPDGYRTALVLGNPNGTHPGLRMTELVYVSGRVGRLTAVSPISYGQPAVAVATNGITVAYPATGYVLLTTGTIVKNYRTVMVGGVGAVALN
jgi:parallel beta-helix repeat protein